MSAFDDLLKEVGTYFGLNLHVDQNQSCRLQFAKDLYIQIDLDSSGEKLLIGTELGKLIAGPYREQILKQALRVNTLSQVPKGTLAYSNKHSSLVLFHYMPLADLNGEKLFKFLLLFLEHAKIWVECLKRSEVPQLEEEMAEKREKGPL